MTPPKTSRRKLAQRRAAAEEVCWALTLMMNLTDPAFISRRTLMGWIERELTTWADLAVETGALKA